MAYEFIAPGKIVTGSGSLGEIAKYIDGFGKKALIVCDQITEKSESSVPVVEISSWLLVKLLGLTSRVLNDTQAESE